MPEETQGEPPRDGLVELVGDSLEPVGNDEFVFDGNEANWLWDDPLFSEYQIDGANLFGWSPDDIFVENARHTDESGSAPPGTVIPYIHTASTPVAVEPSAFAPHSALAEGTGYVPPGLTDNTNAFSSTALGSTLHVQSSSVAPNLSPAMRVDRLSTEGNSSSSEQNTPSSSSVPIYTPTDSADCNHGPQSVLAWSDFALDDESNELVGQQTNSETELVEVRNTSAEACGPGESSLSGMLCMRQTHNPGTVVV